jgi:hypothetical protein
VLHGNVVEDRSGFKLLGGAELEAVSGGQWQAPAAAALKKMIEGFFSGLGGEAAESAVDAVTGEDDATAQELFGREQAINPQYNPTQESTDFQYTKDNGVIVHGQIQGGQLFMDSNNNGAFDSVSVVGADGRLYIDTGDGRGYIGYIPGTEPWNSTLPNETIGVGIVP